MEYRRDTLKYTVTLTSPTVTIDCIDYVSLCDYRVTIAPNQYDGVKTPERLYAIIIDGFEGKKPECCLTLEKDKVVNAINMVITVISYMYNVTIVEALRPVKELNEIRLLTNKINWFNETLKKGETRIEYLEEQMHEMRQFLPWLELWKYWIPHANARSIATEENTTLCKTRSVKSSAPIQNDTNIVINGNTLAVQGQNRIAIDSYPYYPVYELLALYNPTEITIEGAQAMKGMMKGFIEINIRSMTNLKKLTVTDVPITSVAAIASLPKIAELTFRRCKQIRDLEKLIAVKTLEVLNVTPDINTGVFAGGVHFVINIVQ